MTNTTPRGPAVLQLRLIVEAEDYDEAVAFYRDALGLSEQAAFEGDGDARVAILEAGRATLEIANPAQKRMIDEVEVGRPVEPEDPRRVRGRRLGDEDERARRRRGDPDRGTDRDAVAIAELPARGTRRVCRSRCSRSSNRSRSGPVATGSAPPPNATSRRESRSRAAGARTGDQGVHAGRRG